MYWKNTLQEEVNFWQSFLIDQFSHTFSTRKEVKPWQSFLFSVSSHRMGSCPPGLTCPEKGSFFITSILSLFKIHEFSFPPESWEYWWHHHAFQNHLFTLFLLHSKTLATQHREVNPIMFESLYQATHKISFMVWGLDNFFQPSV